MKRNVVLAALAALLVCALPLAAQTVTGSVNGTVSDTTGAVLPGVTVEATSPNLQGTRTAVTDTEGKFRFPNLPPGDYTFTFKLEGFSVIEKEGVAVRIATNTGLSVSLTPAVSETIVVQGERVVVDPTKSTIDTAVDWELMDTLATNRNFQSVMELAPGVQVGANNPRVNGAGDSDNLYLVDGFDTTDPRTQTWGTAINYDTIQEVQVQTAGMAAEFGRVTGGVVNVVTKSGGNDFHGIFRYVQNKVDWVANPRPGVTATTASDENRPSGSLGGPIMKDKLWFFGAYESRDRKQTFPRETGSNSGVFTTDTSTYKGHYVSGKLTLQPTPNHSFVGYYNEDPIDISNAWARYYLGPSVDPRSEGIQQQGGNNWAAGWTGVFSSKTFMEGKFNSYDGNINVIPQHAVGPDPTFLDLISGYWSGTTLEDYRSKRARQDLSASLSHFLEGAAGDHQFKFGVEWLEVKNKVNDVYYPQGNYVLTIGDQYYFRGERYNREGVLTTKDPYFAFYAQDSWKINRLTLNLGVRSEQVTLKNNVGTDVVKFNFQDQIAPRLGFAYDLNGNSLHGSASRFYDIVTDYVTAGLNRNRERERDYIWLPYYGYGCSDPSQNANGNLGSDCWLEIADYALFTSNAVNPNLKPTYTDEVTLGYDQRLTSNMSFGVNLIWREQKDAIEDFDSGTNGDAVADDGAFYYNNVPGKFKEYQAIQVQLRKRYSEDRFQFVTSYTYAFKDKGYSSTSQFSGYADSSVALVNRYGATDTPSLFKFDGSYTLPWGSLPTSTVFGLSGFYYSGPVYAIYNRRSVGVHSSAQQYVKPDEKVGSEWEVDLHVEQGFDFAKTVSASIYVDALNLFNKQDPINRSGRIGSSLFGKPTSWQTPRRIQAGLKIEF